MIPLSPPFHTIESTICLTFVDLRKRKTMFFSSFVYFSLILMLTMVFVRIILVIFKKLCFFVSRIIFALECCAFGQFFLVKIFVHYQRIYTSLAMHWHNGKMNKNSAISTLKKKATARAVPTVTLAELNHAFYFKANVYIILTEPGKNFRKRILCFPVQSILKATFAFDMVFRHVWNSSSVEHFECYIDLNVDFHTDLGVVNWHWNGRPVLSAIIMHGQAYLTLLLLEHC